MKCAPQNARLIDQSEDGFIEYPAPVISVVVIGAVVERRILILF